MEDTIRLLVEHGDEAKFLAGGQSLVPMLNFRLARPQYLIDINRVEGLDYIYESEVGLTIGAMTRQRSLKRSEIIRHHYPFTRLSEF